MFIDVESYLHNNGNLLAVEKLLASHLLLRELLLGCIAILSLGDNQFLLTEHHFDVAWARHVGIDTTVSTVGSATHLWSSVDLLMTQIEIEIINLGQIISCERTYHDVLNNKPVDVQTLEVSVALGVSQKLEQKLGTLLRPASLGGAPCLALGLTTDASIEATEWDDFLLNNDVLEETLSTAQGHSLDGLSGLTGVLEVHPEIAASRLAGLG